MQNATAVPRDGGSGVPAVRNLDPRMKLLIVLVVGSAALFSPHRALLLWCYAIIAALWLLSGEARRALGFVAVLAAVALAEWGAGFIPNATVAGMVGFLFFIFARSLSTFALIMWMSVGLRIDDLIASLQRLRLPRGLVITIAVVFRYLPTAADEFRKISATSGCAVWSSRRATWCCIPAARSSTCWCRSLSAPSKSPTIWPLPP